MVRAEVFVGMVKSGQLEVIQSQGKMGDILKAIYNVTGYRLEDLQKHSMKTPLPVLRAIFAEYMYEPNVYTYGKIAEILGYRDRTGVMALFRQTLPGIHVNQSTKELYQQIHSYL